MNCESKIISWQILTFLLLKIVIILMRLKIKGKWEFKLPAVQFFGHIFKLVSAHLDQNKAGAEKQAKIQNVSIISDIFQNQNIRKYVRYIRCFSKSKYKPN